MNLLLSAALASTVTLLAREVVAWWFTGLRLKEALRAEAKGAQRHLKRVAEQANSSADVAGMLLSQIDAGKSPTFEDVTKLKAGWILRRVVEFNFTRGCLCDLREG